MDLNFKLYIHRSFLKVFYLFVCFSRGIQVSTSSRAGVVFFFLSLLIKMFMLCGWVFCLHVSLCTMCMSLCVPAEVRKGTASPAGGGGGVELLTVVSYHGGRNWTWVLWRSASAQNCWVTSPAPAFLFVCLWFVWIGLVSINDSFEEARISCWWWSDCGTQHQYHLLFCFLYKTLGTHTALAMTVANCHAPWPHPWRVDGVYKQWGSTLASWHGTSSEDPQNHSSSQSL